MGIFGKLLIVLLLFLFTSGTVWAKSTSPSATTKNPFEQIREKLLERREQVQDKRQETRNKIQTKRDEAKVRICEAKEKVLTNRTTSLTRVVTTIEEKFTNIVEGVKAFYTEKGLTVENYDELLADIDVKKAAADAALASATANAEAFTCDSDDPKGQLTQFRQDMQAVKKALNDYKQSIRNLIVAVKTASSANGEEANE